MAHQQWPTPPQVSHGFPASTWTRSTELQDLQNAPRSRCHNHHYYEDHGHAPEKVYINAFLYQLPHLHHSFGTWDSITISWPKSNLPQAWRFNLKLCPLQSSIQCLGQAVHCRSMQQWKGQNNHKVASRTASLGALHIEISLGKWLKCRLRTCVEIALMYHHIVTPGTFPRYISELQASVQSFESLPHRAVWHNPKVATPKVGSVRQCTKSLPAESGKMILPLDAQHAPSTNQWISMASCCIQGADTIRKVLFLKARSIKTKDMKPPITKIHLGWLVAITISIVILWFFLCFNVSVSAPHIMNALNQLKYPRWMRAASYSKWSAHVTAKYLQVIPINIISTSDWIANWLPLTLQPEPSEPCLICQTHVIKYTSDSQELGAVKQGNQGNLFLGLQYNNRCWMRTTITPQMQESNIGNKWEKYQIASFLLTIFICKHQIWKRQEWLSKCEAQVLRVFEVGTRNV